LPANRLRINDEIDIVASGILPAAWIGMDLAQRPTFSTGLETRFYGRQDVCHYIVAISSCSF